MIYAAIILGLFAIGGIIFITYQKPAGGKLVQAAILSATSFPETWRYWLNYDERGWKNDDFKVKRSGSEWPYKYWVNGWKISKNEYKQATKLLERYQAAEALQKFNKESDELLHKTIKKAQKKLEDKVVTLKAVG